MIKKVKKREDRILCKIHPELVSEWDYKKNGDITPENITYGSTFKAWWICKDCGHSWLTAVYLRSQGTGCPICNRKKCTEEIQKKYRKKHGNLLLTNPELAAEWHPTKNRDLKPTDVTYGSNKKVWWKCSKCGHEWQSKIVARKYCSTCPNCSRGHKNNS